MHSRDTVTEYSLISKLLHWTSAIILFVQIPLGFYLVDLDFGPERLNIENKDLNLECIKVVFRQ